MRCSALYCTTVFLLLAAGLRPVQAQTGEQKNPAAATTRMAEITWNLDSMLASALRSNPDVLLAEAKLKQAQAELNQVRLKVTQAVMELVTERDAAIQRVETTGRTGAEMRSLVNSGRVSVAEEAKAQADFLDARTGHSRIEARARYLCGTGAGGESTTADTGAGNRSDPLSSGAAPSAGAVDSAASRRFLPAAGGPDSQPKMPNAIANRLLQKIDTDLPVRTLGEALDALRKSAGIAVVVDPLYGNAEELLQKELAIASTEPMPISAWIQLVADTCEVVFVAREYGFLVTTEDRASGFDAATIPTLRRAR